MDFDYQVNMSKTELMAEAAAVEERPAAWGMWSVPGRVWRRGERIYWSLTWKGGDVHQVTSTADLLPAFLALADGTPKEVSSFVRRWGPLYGTSGKCLAEAPSPLLLPPCDGCGPVGGEPYWEPVEGWRAAARQTRAMLYLAHNLREGRLGDETHWRDLGYVEDPAGVDGWLGTLDRLRKGTPPDRLAHQERELRMRLNGWITAGGVATHFTRLHPAEVAIAPEGLFGAVVSRLVVAIAGSGWAICSECGAPFVPNRRPARGRRAFCSRCGLPAARRAASRDYERRRLSESD